MGFAEGYNEVNSRIAEFRAKYPDGTLQRHGDFQIVVVDGVTYLAYTAAAYRTPDDPRPGIGTAWERVPGLTNYTKNSELQNAETSAWGRAIIAVGAADAKKGIASAEDVAWRNAEAEQRDRDEAAVGGMRTSILGAIAKLNDDQKAELKAWFRTNELPAVERMTQAQCDLVTDWIMHQPKVEP